MKILQYNFKDKNEFLSEVEKAQIPLEHSNILIQVFSGNIDLAYLQDLLKFLRTTFPNCVLAGATTDGEIYNDQVLQHNIIISIFFFEQSTVQVEKTDFSIGNAFDQGVYLGKKLQKDDLKTIILFGEGLSINGEDLLTGLVSQIGDIVVAGGLAGDNWGFEQTYVFYQDEIIDKGAVAVGIYSDTLRVKSLWTFDCDVLGKTFMVTQAQGNMVKKIDDITPEALYRQYLGDQIDVAFIRIGAQFPLVTRRQGELLARTPLSLCSDGALRFAGNLKEGEKVQFAIAHKEKILSKAYEIYNDINDQWDAICIFSCTGRKRVLGSKITLDICNYKNIAPVTGFFSYGEFVKETKKASNFCNQTMVLLLLSESENRFINKPAIEEYNYTSISDNFSKFTSSILHETEKKNAELSQTVASQIRTLEQNNRLLRELFYKDPLTGLKNRALLFQEIEQKEIRGVMLIDIQNFRAINDLYGESVGNLILKSFADFLRRFADNYEYIYRLGSNTFAFLNVFALEEDSCMATGRELVRAVESENFHFENDGIPIECAISVTIGISNDKEGENPLEHADMALNYAKNNHRSVVLYRDSLQVKEGYEYTLGVVKMVKKALEEDRIKPFFQPIFKGDNVSYYEALIRLENEDGSILTPFYFLDTIKQTTYYSYLTKIMIEKTFEIFFQLDFNVSINLSFLDFSNSNTMEYLIRMIKEYNMGKKFIIEILESEVFQDYEKTIEQIKYLRSLGVKIAIDDFGSGYSNFLHLTLIEPDYIKIDGSLIKNIDKDPKTLAVCKAVIGFAKAINIKTIAEFIHSKEILDITTELQVDKHQGFYLGEPASADDLFGDLISF